MDRVKEYATKWWVTLIVGLIVGIARPDPFKRPSP